VSLLSREEASALTQRVLGMSRAEAARVTVTGALEANTRFAASDISTSGDAADVGVTVRSSFGRRSAVASTNILTDEGLRRAVEMSERLARLAPEDREAMPELDPPAYREVPAFFAATASLDPARRADAAVAVIEPARRAGMQAAGFLSLAARATAVANHRGLFAYHRSTAFAFTTTVRTADGTGSGWAGTAHNDWGRARPAELGATAIRKAELSRNPVAIEPGRYTVILEPTAVANLLQLLVGAMNARAADEGRSFFAKRGGGNKIGEQVVDQRVTIVSDPWDPDLLAAPFAGDGLPNRRVVWIESGVVRNLNYDRFWAQRQGVEPTGGGAGFGFGGGGFGGAGVKMSGADASLEDLIRATERGVLVTRFWYIRGLDPRTILYTGLTRDGTFLIENGRITRAVKNMRFNESPVTMLNNVEMLGRPVRVSASESGDIGGAIVVPPVKARDFNFQSISDAV
jgi:predicted Zn-dependent protease